MTGTRSFYYRETEAQKGKSWSLLALGLELSGLRTLRDLEGNTPVFSSKILSLTHFYYLTVWIHF